MKKKTRPPPSSNIVRPKGKFIDICFRLCNLIAGVPAPVRHTSTSDSDSEYGSRNHKRRRKAKTSGDEIRVSSRGGKVPNYVDDVQDFEKFDDDNETENGYYADPNILYEEEHEIEAVLGHSRDEGHENDLEDRWFENIVCVAIDTYPSLTYITVLHSAIILNGRTSPTSITQTRYMSS